MGTPPFFTIPPGCAIVFMGAAILEQPEQLAYKESFPTTTMEIGISWVIREIFQK